MPVQVRIKNFQSIKSSTIDIDGLTVVTGPNNSGKTALMRAIRGVFQNTPGTSFVRHGATKSSVELSFSDGRSVRWEKGPKMKPTYYIDGSTKAIHPGRGVPEQLREFGVESIKAGDQQVWPQVASQFTGQVFLLDQPGSVLAEAVANVDRVGKLNTALKLSEKDGRTTTGELKIRRADRDKHEDDLARYDGLDDALTSVAKAEERQREARLVHKAVSDLKEQEQHLSEWRQAVSQLEGVGAVDLPEEQGPAGQFHEELLLLKALSNSLDQSQAVVEKLGGTESLSLDEADLQEAERLDQALELVLGLHSKRSGALDNVQSQAEDLAHQEKRLAEAQLEVEELLGDLGECPVCGTVTGEVGCDHADLAD